MRSYEASTEIEAPPDRVWSILTDGPGYARLDAGVRVDGRIAEGEQLRVHSEAAPGRAFPVTVVDVVPGRSMRWKGGMPLGLFTGIRTFQLTSEGGNRSRLHVREEYSGPLLSMMWRSMPDLGPSFERFVAGVKAAAERPA